MNALSEQISFVCRGLTVQWNSTTHCLDSKAAKKENWAADGAPTRSLALESSDGKQQEMFHTHRAARTWVIRVSWQVLKVAKAENHNINNPAPWTQHLRWYLSEPRSGVSSARVKRWYLTFSVNTWPWNPSTALRGKKQIKWKLARTLPHVDIVLGTSEGSS